MKNIVYLVGSTAAKKSFYPKTYVGVTNFLHRQLLIHNHRWRPKDAKRRRPLITGAPGKIGWQPIAVVTGFPSESHANKFASLFDNEYGGMGSPQLLKDYRNGIRDPIRYRLEQLGFVTNEYLDILSRKVDGDSSGLPFFLDDIMHKNVQNSRDKVDRAEKNDFMETSENDNAPGTFDSPLSSEEMVQLTVHWRSQEECEDLMNKFSADINHVNEIDIRRIDAENYDPEDEDDDRNYAKLEEERLVNERRQKLLQLSRELDIPIEEVRQVLLNARITAKGSLSQRKGKVSWKSNHYVKVSDDISDYIQVGSKERVEE